ncbi:hypothetical protein MIR68_012262 [Amoeboaphelidium protococcarum]|nr:hypothetical protein MIR68_012262 [Amoeboaphelidium protococcarum]
MATGYALFICWLLLWQNCLFPTIQAVRFGAFHNAGSSAMVQDGQSAHGGANFDSMIQQFTGGDRELLSAIKQIASNTAQRVSFSLDGVIDHLIRMAPRMKEQSHKMVSLVQQRFSGQNPQQMLSQFLQKATGQSGQADEVMSILQSHQQDPHGSTSRLAQFVSQDIFVGDCIKQSRNLQAFIEAAGENKNYQDHLLSYPEHEASVTSVAPKILLALWFASMFVSFTTRQKSMYALASTYRVLLVSFLFVYAAITVGFTTTDMVKIGSVIIMGVFSILLIAMEAYGAKTQFYHIDNLILKGRQNAIDRAVAAAVSSSQDGHSVRQLELPDQHLTSPRFHPTIENIAELGQDRILQPQMDQPNLQPQESGYTQSVADEYQY